MKSIDYLTKEERLFSAIPFFKQPKDGIINWAKELEGEYDDEELEEINQLITDVAAQACTRLIQFITDVPSDKQMIARIICLQKLYENKHGNWLKFQRGHDVTIKSIRAQRDKINEETGLYIQ